MPPKQVRLKVPPKTREEKTDTELVVQAFVKAIAGGVYDTHLDILFAAVDGRIQESQQEPGDFVPPRKPTQDEVPEFARDLRYSLLGERYSGVVVKFLDYMEPRDGDGGIRKAKVECIYGNEDVTAGKVYKVPLTALVEWKEDEKPKPHQPVYGYARGNCRSCGGAVEYNGRGRPPSLCETCRWHGKK